MSQVEAWTLLVGAIVPVLVAVVNQPGWNATVRRIVAVGVSLVIGLGTVVAQGLADFSPAGALVTIAAVVGAAQAAYALIWKPSGTTDSVERATSRTTP
jgi:hypothetical protein